jgi:capsular exopolysaccharide synthesis family protein
MSRINEGWRRQTEASGALPNAPNGAALAEQRGSEVSLLDRYAIEGDLEGGQDRRHNAVGVMAVPNSKQRTESRPHVREGKLVGSRGVPGICVEQYRRLAVTLHELQSQQGLKILMVASSAPREGKTLTITNLALTLSESFHQRVLLIDADLRRPAIHETLGIPNEAGLTDMLHPGVRSAPLVELSARLSVLPAGRSHPNPLTLLTSAHLPALVSDAAARFDWILFDTPPIGVLPDAQTVARVCEGILFVIAAGVTPYSEVQKSITELGADRIVGTVLNRVDERILGGSKYSGHYYT